MILDTNFLIQLDNNHPEAIQKARELEKSSKPQRIPDIVVFELWVSVGKGGETESNLEDLKRVINRYPRAELTRDISKRAGIIEGTLQQKDPNDSGVGSADAIIAATALEFGEPVVTDNISDFVRRIKKQADQTELQVESFIDRS